MVQWLVRNAVVIGRSARCAGCATRTRRDAGVGAPITHCGPSDRQRESGDHPRPYTPPKILTLAWCGSILTRTEVHCDSGISLGVALDSGAGQSSREVEVRVGIEAPTEPDDLAEYEVGGPFHGHGHGF